MSQEQKNTTFIVDIGENTYSVTAAKSVYDERYYPTFIQLRDSDGEIVALVPIGAHPLIRRQDSDPTLKPRPSAQTGPQVIISTTQPGGPQPGGAPSPAALAALREHAAKAARV